MVDDLTPITEARCGNLLVQSFHQQLCPTKRKADEMMLDISDALPVSPLCGDAPYNFVAAGCIYRETPWLVFSFTAGRGLVPR